MEKRPDIPNVVSMDELRKHRKKPSQHGSGGGSAIPLGVRLLPALFAIILTVHLATSPYKGGVEYLFVWALVYWMVFLNPNNPIVQKYQQYKVIYIVFGVLLVMVFPVFFIQLGMLGLVYWFLVKALHHVPVINHFLKVNILTTIALTATIWFAFLFLNLTLSFLFDDSSSLISLDLLGRTLGLRQLVYLTAGLVLSVTAMLGKQPDIPWISRMINP